MRSAGMPPFLAVAGGTTKAAAIDRWRYMNPTDQPQTVDPPTTEATTPKLDGASGATAKRCSLCGKDVAHHWRVKHDNGYYYCHACYRKRKGLKPSNKLAPRHHRRRGRCVVRRHPPTPPLHERLSHARQRPVAGGMASCARLCPTFSTQVCSTEAVHGCPLAVIWRWGQDHGLGAAQLLARSLHHGQFQSHAQCGNDPLQRFQRMALIVGVFEP